MMYGEWWFLITQHHCFHKQDLCLWTGWGTAGDESVTVNFLLPAKVRMIHHSASEKGKLNPISITMIKWLHHSRECPIAKDGNLSTCMCHPALIMHPLMGSIALCKSQMHPHVSKHRHTHRSLDALSLAHVHRYTHKHTPSHEFVFDRLSLYVPLYLDISTNKRI